MSPLLHVFDNSEHIWLSTNKLEVAVVSTEEFAAAGDGVVWTAKYVANFLDDLCYSVSSSCLILQLLPTVQTNNVYLLSWWQLLLKV